MSDFEQWALTKGGYTSDDLVKIKGHPELEDGDYEYEYVRSARDAFNGAIASMQGEKTEPSGYTDVETLNRWHRLRGTDYEVVERGYLPFSSKPFKTDDTDCTTAVWLSPPPSAASKIAEQAAEIARLTKELEEARCQIELLGNSEQLLIKEIVELKTAISSLVDRDLTYIDGKVSDGLYWTDIQCLRNAIRQTDTSLNIKGGAE